MAKTISVIMASLGFASAQNFPLSLSLSQQAHQQVQDLLAPIRRLKEMPALPAACKTACPSFEAAFQEISQHAPAGPTEAGLAGPSDAGPTDMGGMFIAMCKHKTSLECVSTQPACSNVTDLDGLKNSTAMMPCLCTACPCMAHAFGSAMSGPAGGGPAGPNQMLKMCPLIEPMECVANQADCKTVSTQMGSFDPSMLGMMKNMCISQNQATRPSACDGTDSGTTCGDVKDAYKSAGCCGNPSKRFAMPRQRRRLEGETDAIVEEVKVALGRSKEKGVLAKQIKSTIDEVLKERGI